MYTNPSFEKMLPNATHTSLSCGCQTDWYDHGNVDACLLADLGEPPYTDKQVLWAKAWFAEIGWYDKYADYMSNAWTGQIVAGPFATEQEAYYAAEDYISEHYPEGWQPGE